MTQYLQKFIPNLSDKTHNMRLLLKKNTASIRDAQLDQDFCEIKNLVKESSTLAYFDQNKNVTISVDARFYGLGAVLHQEVRSIAFSSTALNSSQQAYPQIERKHWL